jgi:hypothetical protein
MIEGVSAGRHVRKASRQQEIRAARCSHVIQRYIALPSGIVVVVILFNTEQLQAMLVLAVTVALKMDSDRLQALGGYE